MRSEVIKNRKYGAMITDFEDITECLTDVFDTYKEAVSFVKMIEENEVTCTSLKYVFVDYQYEKYQKFKEIYGE